MIRLTILLAFVVRSEAERYGDYSGVQMAHFGIAYDNKESSLSDEYLDHSPDAAASLDYKYEEETINKIASPYIEDEDSWQTRSKNRFKSINNVRDEDYPDEHDTEHRFKSKRRFQKHRPRIKHLYNDGKRKSVEYDETSNEDVNYLGDNEYINKRRSKNNNRIDLDNFKIGFTTKRVARRKPRDRTISREPQIFLQDESLNSKEHDDDVFERAYREKNHQILDRTRLPLVDLEKIKHNNYPDYEDTMRFNTIKNKLPALLRQTKATASLEVTPSTRMLHDITYRRANLLEKLSEGNFLETSSLVSTADNIVTITLTNSSQEITEKPTPSNSTELSLAEKSRLSILRKVQKKEGSFNVTRTTKPPVLMQVTKQLQTVVMIESPNRDMQLRSREVFDDSPERLNRAKKLMRRKLISGARSFNELIDNWDEMVCDYIDTSLLDSGCANMQIDLRILFFCVINHLITIVSLNKLW